MTDTRAALQAAAVEALASYQQADADGVMVLVSRQAIEECLPTLRAALADAPEPVAWHVTYANGETIYLPYKPTGDSGVYGCDPLYSAPPAIAAQDAPPAAPKVTDEALRNVRKVRDGYADQMKFCDVEAHGYFREFIRRIDAALSPPSAPGGGT